MKLTLSDIRDKTVAVINRIGKKGTVVICAVILVGFAAMLNLILFNGEETGKKSNLAIDMDALSVGDSGEEADPSYEAVYNYF